MMIKILIKVITVVAMVSFLFFADGAIADEPDHDVIIVGGGIAGLTAAFFIDNADM